MDPYRQLDFLDLEDLLTEEETLVRDTVRAWVSERYLPHVMEYWEEGIFPRELLGELGELGVFGSTLPEEYGGVGGSHVMSGVICRELERGDSGLRSVVSVQGSLAMHAIWAYGSEEQRREWLPAMGRGEKIGCFGLTEPDYGSNPGGMESRARRDGDDWIIDGRKMWITNGTIADVAIVWAKTEEGIRGFAVPTALDGFQRIKMKHKWSLRTSPTAELVLDEVRVPARCELPGAQGLGAALGCLTQARYGIAWGVVGAALACFDEARRYAENRIVFDRALASFQLVQTKLADYATRITLAQLLVLRLGRLKEEGKLQHAQVTLAKRNNVACALETARGLRDMLGANGITLEYGIGRHMLNLESVSTYEGAHDVLGLAIGEHLTGIPAYR